MKWELSGILYCFGLDEEITGISVDKTGGIYVSTLNGAIARYVLNDSGEPEKLNSYYFELKCKGANIDGVIPEKAYDILRWAKE